MASTRQDISWASKRRRDWAAKKGPAYGNPASARVVRKHKRKTIGGEFSNRSLEDNPEITILDSGNSDVGTPQKRRCVQAKSLATTTTIPILPLEVIDLTDNTENCALCSNILGEGDDYIARIFVFGTCRCVVCGECLLSIFPKEERKSMLTIPQLWCPRHDHFDMGEQKAYELFGTDCLICLEKAADAVDRIRTHCGHSFCRGCITNWIKTGNGCKCPICKSNLPFDPTNFGGFETVQRGVIRQMNLGR